jgi:hypothetical protein
MGAEAKCSVRVKGQTDVGTARLETEALQFRGRDVRLSIPFKAMKRVEAIDGELRVTSADSSVALALGAAAAKWADKIKNPPSRLQKLGVKPGWRVSAVGIADAVFLRELEGAVAALTIGRVRKPSDAIFFGADREAQLGRLDKLKDSIERNGAIWVIRPKGRKEISESAVMAAGKAAGLVDVKVVSFSPTHTAEKFVIPVAKR